MDPWHYKPATDTGLSTVERWRSERREPGLISTLAHTASNLALRTYFRLYHRLHIQGVEHIPTSTPFVMVANHASHLDALVIAACLPRRVTGSVFPIAAGDVFFETTVVSAFAATLINALPMWRKRVGRHALDDLKARLHSGDCGFILFPEGARTRDGLPLKWKAGIGMMVAGTSIPVVPCRIDGCLQALHPDAKLPSPTRICVTITAPMLFAHQPDSREGWDAIADALRVRVVGS